MEKQLNLENDVFPEITLEHASVDGMLTTTPKFLFETIKDNVQYETEIEDFDGEDLRLISFNEKGETVTFKFMTNEEKTHITHCRVEYIDSSTSWDVPLPVAYNMESNVWTIWEANIDKDKTDIEKIDPEHTLNAFVSRSVYYVNRVFDDKVDFETIQKDLVLTVSSFIANKPKEIDNSTIFAKLFMIVSNVAVASGITPEDMETGFKLVETLQAMAAKAVEEKNDGATATEDSIN